MTDSTKSAVQFLQELRKERDELNTLIQVLEKRLGISSSQHASNTDREDEGVVVFASSGPATSAVMPIGFFHNLSLAAAAEKLLKANPHQALTTAQILEAITNSGRTIASKNALTILYTALRRNPKFERIGKKAWGLKEWYPERKKRISREPETTSSSDEA